jgi:cbb3-type cytochrome oxidase maturation protein
MTGIIAYLLVVSALVVLVLAIGIIWAIKSGQFEDLEGPAHRILMDDDDPRIPKWKPGSKD